MQKCRNSAETGKLRGSADDLCTAENCNPQ